MATNCAASRGAAREPAAGDRRGGERRDIVEPGHRVRDPQRRHARGPGDERARDRHREDRSGQHRRDYPRRRIAPAPGPGAVRAAAGRARPTSRRGAAATACAGDRPAPPADRLIRAPGGPARDLHGRRGRRARAAVGYPHGGVPRFVWPASPVPLPAIGIGRLSCAAGPPSCGRRGGCRAATPAGRCSSGSVAGCASRRSPMCSTTGRVAGNPAHIPAPVLRAYLAAADGGGL